MTTYSAIPSDDRCECFDTGDNHPINNSGRDGMQCTRKATSTLWRVDMEDVSGTRFCDECASDAMGSGLFTDTVDADEGEDLLANGSAEECPACGAISAYAWQDVNYCPQADVDKGLPESERVYHIGSASGFEWECGKCRRSWTPADSPLTAACYTHSED